MPPEELKMFKSATPLLHVSSSASARKSYCDQLGFKLEFADRADEKLADPCYVGLSRDGVRIILSSFSGDGVAGGVVNFNVGSVNALYAEFQYRTGGPNLGHA
jgi:hypothetical protein